MKGNESKSGMPLAIEKIETVCTADAQNCWPDGEPTDRIDRDAFAAVAFWITTDPAEQDGQILLDLCIRNAAQMPVFAETVRISAEKGNRQFSRVWEMTDEPDAPIRPGNYVAEISVGGGEPVEYRFEIIRKNVPETVTQPVETAYRAPAISADADDSERFRTALVDDPEPKDPPEDGEDRLIRRTKKVGNFILALFGGVFLFLFIYGVIIRYFS